MSAISELIERVEKATGADREIDRDVWLAFNMYPAGIEDIGCYFDPASGCTGGNIYTADEVTASLDAALALVEAKLPGWSYGVAMRGDKLRREGCDDERAYAWLKNGEQAEADAPTLALALCLALLRALEEQKP